MNGGIFLKARGETSGYATFGPGTFDEMARKV
jgi:hypothetical protein